MHNASFSMFSFSFRVAPPTPVDHEEGEETEAPPPSPSPDVPLSSLTQRHLSEITDVSHLIKIMSVFVMMAQVEGRGSPAHKDHLLTALDICVIIWKACWVGLCRMGNVCVCGGGMGNVCVWGDG